MHFDYFAGSSSMTTYSYPISTFPYSLFNCIQVVDNTAYCHYYMQMLKMLSDILQGQNCACLWQDQSTVTKLHYSFTLSYLYDRLTVNYRSFALFPLQINKWRVLLWCYLLLQVPSRNVTIFVNNSFVCGKIEKYLTETWTSLNVMQFLDVNKTCQFSLYSSLYDCH